MKGFLRRVLLAMMTATALVALSTAATAAVLEWEGTLQLDFGPSPALVGIGAGVATINGTGGGGPLSTLRLAGGISASGAFLLTDPNVPTIATMIRTAALGTGTLVRPGGTGPLTSNTLPVGGNAKVCLLFVGCMYWLEFPFTVNATRGLGIGGVATVNGFGAGLRMSVLGAPWTIATASVSGVFTTNGMIPPANRATANRTLVGFAHGPASNTSTAADPGAVIQLVSASMIRTTLMTPSNYTPMFGTLTLHIMPEPSTFLLFGFGMAAFGMAGRMRKKR